ncbi:hypothetical protein ES703_82962 [subsurface metagenome]
MSFAARMRLMRAFRNLTQEELMRRLAMPQPVISKLETGDVLPSDALRKRIQTALGWDEAVDRLLEKLDIEAPPAA